MDFNLSDDQRAIAEAVKRICARFPDEYWSHKDTAAEFPHEFHAAMAADGWLGITMPEVWVYNSPDPNAFATGPSKNNSMVAVSTGLLQNLKEGEVKAVLAHEMGHVYNGDMFTTTVLAGLMNTFVHYISNFLSSMVGQPSGQDREEGSSAGNPILALVVYIVLQVVLSFLAMLVVSWHSRRREFAADAFSAPRAMPRSA